MLPVTRPKSTLEDLLDEDQTQKFAQWLKMRHDTVRGQLQAGLWEKRKRYEQQMNDDFSWRLGGGTRQETLDAGIEELCAATFSRSNASLNIVGGFAAFMCARAVDDIKGTEPYYNLMPEGLADDELADAMQRHSEWKLHQSNVSDAIDDAIDLAFGLGEGIIKFRYAKDVDIYERKQKVLFHVPTRKPVVDATGEYINEGDQMGQADEPAQDAYGEPVPDPLTGEPTTRTVLTFAKDPDLTVPLDEVTWKEMAIEEVNITYRGVKAEVVHFRDFLCPEQEADPRESNFVGQRFQLRLSEAIELYGLSEELIAKFKTDSNERKADGAMPNTEQGEVAEGEISGDYDDPFILFCESWVRFDPVGDRRNRRLWAVLAVDHEEIVAMDYIANVTPDGQLPFFNTRAYRVKNRWHGRGYYETYEKAQEFIDLQLNRIEYRNQYHTNPPTFFDKTLLVESDETDEPFRLEMGQTYQKRPGVKSEDVWSIVTLPDLDERTWQLMQFMIQIVQVRSGVTSAAQGEVSSLPSTATATGIESIMQSASTLARLPIGNLKESLEPGLLYACRLIYANLDADETYTYFEGDRAKTGLLVQAGVQGLKMNVRLLMTRFRQREQVENGMKAIAVVNWYIALPEQEKAGPRQVGIQVIKGLGYNHADQILRQPIQPMIDPATGLPVQPPAGQPGQPAQPPGQPAPAGAPSGIPAIPGLPS